MFVALASPTALAGDRYVLIVSGASGGPEYAQKYHEWRESFTMVLRAKLGYSEDQIAAMRADRAI